MAHVATGAFSSNPLAFQFSATIPDRFRLAFEFESACTTGVGAMHRPRFEGLKSTVEFSTQTLLATAALRHSGTSYHLARPGMAMAKELMIWCGWLDVRGDGSLRLENATNAGRLGDVAASLGEAVALDLATSVFGLALPLWTRIPESGTESMDFKAPGPNGDIAIEAKGGHGSVVAARKKEILVQKARQTLAAEKYGFVLCYEMAGRPALSVKGSYVKIVDPPGDNVPPTPIRDAIATHYFQLAKTIGLRWLEDYLAAVLAPDSSPVERKSLQGAGRRMVGAHNPRLAVRQEDYVGRYFDVERELGRAASTGLSARPARYFFFGIAKSVIGLLLDGDFDEVLKIASKESLGFAESREGKYGPILLTGLPDGVMRVDLVSMAQLLGEDIERTA